jgi:methylated-DNA-[protein]-cysteine S-methyltransferase
VRTAKVRTALDTQWFGAYPLRMALGLFIDRIASPIGTILLVFDGAGRVRALDFEDHEDRLHRLLRRHYGPADQGYRLTMAPAPASITAHLQSFFSGDLSALEGIEVACGGTAFQREVWAALRRIPSGTTTTYGRLAASIGRADASRAVGAANGANPIAIIVPCHRVIGAGGNLTGYAGGVDRKQWLLAHERAGGSHCGMSFHA